jgi:hypothetical protein
MSENDSDVKTTHVQVNKEQAEAIKAILSGKGEEAKKLSDLETENKNLKAELLKKETENKDSGRGSLPANLNSDYNSEGSKEFPDFPSMVEYLKINDREQYNKLFAKGIQALREFPQSFEYRDQWVDGTSCIAKAIQKQNEKVRKRG